MKKLMLIAFSLLTLSCKKDSISPDDKILSITIDGRRVQSFEYDQNGRLVSESEYFSCTTTPMNKYAYTYKDGKLQKVNSVVRAHYSSIAAQCDPSAGLHLEDVFFYDSAGRITRTVGATTTRENLYNSEGLVIKRLLGGGSNKFFEYFYDSRGNVIKEIDPEGNVTEYEFDSSPNPFYRHRPHIGTAFTMSPNNVIKGKGASNFVRKFEYRSNLPVKILEDNGQTYIYHYE